MKYLKICLISIGIILGSQICFASPKLSKETLLIELKKQNIHHPDIVLAQSLLETGHFKSKLCKNHNNLFGIRKNGKYVRYNSWIDSVADYKKSIQNKYRKGEDYYSFIKRIKYASDPNYIRKLKKLI